MTSILCIGNYGSGNKNQYSVANLLEYLYKKYNYKLIIGLGNNILPDGVKSKNDKKFKENFENPYKEILTKVKFYNILGDKDYINKKTLQSELNYTNKSWVLPHNFYCFKKFINNVPIEFIMMDSNLKKMKNKKTQESWILNTILESKSKWNILISHHPWYNFDNDSSIETEDNDLKELYEKINKTNKIDLIVSGHVYNQQHIYIPNKPNMIISGVGSQNNEYPILKVYKQLKFSNNQLGCVIIDVKKNTLRISFYNINKKNMYNFSIHKY